MKTITNRAYLVLSVNDCKALLATAKRSQKAALTASGSHCIVLLNLRVLEDENDGDIQVSSASISLAAREDFKRSSKSIAADVRAELDNAI